MISQGFLAYRNRFLLFLTFPIIYLFRDLLIYEIVNENLTPIVNKQIMHTLN